MERLLQQFGENVRQARRDRGWTQEDPSAKTDLAGGSGLKDRAWKARDPPEYRLLDGLDIQPDVLLKGWSSKCPRKRGKTTQTPHEHKAPEFR